MGIPFNLNIRLGFIIHYIRLCRNDRRAFRQWHLTTRDDVSIGVQHTYFGYHAGKIMYLFQIKGLRDPTLITLAWWCVQHRRNKISSYAAVQLEIELSMSWWDRWSWVQLSKGARKKTDTAIYDWQRAKWTRWKPTIPSWATTRERTTNRVQFYIVPRCERQVAWQPYFAE